MKQEFVTLYGRAIVERNTLYLRSPYLPFEKTAFAQVGIEMVWLALLVSRLFAADSSWRVMITIFWGLLVISRIPFMYDKFFKWSYARRIPLIAISDITIQDDIHGMQTEVKLHLKNGRYKKILFRKLENQTEAFSEAVISYSAAQTA